MIRPAAVGDFQFIHNLEAIDRAHGHYVRVMRIGGDADDIFKKNFMHMVGTGQCLATKNEKIKGEVWICEEGSRPIGFAYVVELPSYARELFKLPTREIQMLSIHPDHRRVGHGKCFTQALLDEYKEHKYILARCAVASGAMKALLNKLQFLYLSSSDDGFELYGNGPKSKLMEIGDKLRAIARKIQ